MKKYLLILLTIVSIAANAQVAAKSDPIVLTKVRVELTNKEVKDFEITKAKEQKRILKEFYEQYQVMKSRLETQENRDDDLKYGF